MPGKPQISVTMPVYNAEEYLQEAMEGILNQSFTDFEFLIIDDASIDNSPEIIQGFDDKRIKLIRNEKNIGLPESLNKVLKQARGEYIANQDADDISLPNRFTEQIAYFEAHPEVALLGTSSYIIDGKGKIIRKEIASSNPGKHLRKAMPFVHSSVMLRREVIDQLGGYNELSKYSHDYELLLRIARHHNIKSLKQVLCKKRFHEKSIMVTRAEEGCLDHFLAQKLADDALSHEQMRKIKSKGVLELYPDLTHREKAIFHKRLGYSYARSGDLKLSREEYKKAFKLVPFSITNTLSLLLSFLGRSGIEKTRGVNRLLKNIIRSL